MTTQNISQHELDKFNEMAEQWWDPNGPCKPLHLLNPVRLNYIKKQLDLAQKQVLDVGCGGGLLSEAMAREGAQVTGLELAEQVRAAAKTHAEQSGVSINYLGETVEQHTGQYDLITCLEMLEHVPEPQSVIAACSRLLKPGGIAVFSTLNRHPMAFVQAIVGAEYVLKMLPKGTHSYKEFIKPSELDAMLSEQGLHTTDICGIHYKPLREQFTLGGKTWVNYLLTARK
jgi:2-polyprenyl-6-hydroxyphenyl methylase/3-demethylubiquinone-9 3-methyltransferase